LALITNPELLAMPRGAALSAGWFWGKKGLNDLADKQDYKTMTERINGGTLGLDDRIIKIEKVKSVLG